MSAKKVTNHQLFDIIRSPVITEKSTTLSSQGKVTFKVDVNASKADIKKAVEALFDVKVTGVNTLRVEGKTKRFRGRLGKRKDVKKAIITLAEGQTVDVMAGL